MEENYYADVFSQVSLANGRKVKDCIALIDHGEKRTFGPYESIEEVCNYVCASYNIPSYDKFPEVWKFESPRFIVEVPVTKEQFAYKDESLHYLDYLGSKRQVFIILYKKQYIKEL